MEPVSKSFRVAHCRECGSPVKISRCKSGETIVEPCHTCITQAELRGIDKATAAIDKATAAIVKEMK